MLANATRICEASFGNLMLYENGLLRRVALHNTPAPNTEFNARSPLLDPAKVPSLGDLVRTRRAIQVADMAVAEPEFPLLQLGGARTLLVVPMLKDDALIGGIGNYRQEVRPFTDKQVELVSELCSTSGDRHREHAAAQRAAHGRLSESQQQTATADVLKVISRSTFDLQTVLDTLTESAARLCRADRTAIRIARDGLYHHLSDYGFTEGEHRDRVRAHPVAPTGGSMVGGLCAQARPFISSMCGPILMRRWSGWRGYRDGHDARRATAAEGAPIGVLLLQRSNVEPFTDKQIELATTFADQAVIAIENVRLFDEVQERTDELSESLQQQTATADVLKVISRSTFDLQTVLDTLVASAWQLCEADSGNISRPTSEAFVSLPSPSRYAAGDGEGLGAPADQSRSRHGYRASRCSKRHQSISRTF